MRIRGDVWCGVVSCAYFETEPWMALWYTGLLSPSNL